MKEWFLAIGLLVAGAPGRAQTTRAPAAFLSGVRSPAANLGGILDKVLVPAAAAGASTLGGFRLPPAPLLQDVPLPMDPSARVLARPKAPATDEAVRRAFHQVEEAGRQASRHYAGLDARQRKFLFHSVATHKVARLDRLEHYDPTGEIGFCFGRAMAAHLIALRMGLTPDNIRKLFIVGDLRSGDKPEWRFHVTTLVRGADGAWYAIDPILGEPLELSAWIDKVQGVWDKDRKAKLYVTPSHAVMPDVDRVPEPGQETGERLIELKFDPKGREGFEAVQDLPDERTAAFDVDEERASRYFDSSASGQESFDFTRARINGQDYDYRNYFAELAEDLLSAADEDFEPSSGAFEALGAGGPARAPSLTGKNLGSFRVESLLRGAR